MSRADADAGRRRHYATFYGCEPVPAGGHLAAVHGNCQAESLRLALAGPDLPTVRLPPVHELTAEDVPHLWRILSRVTVLISQPVRNGYRDLPLGHEELAACLGATAEVIRIPVIRFAGLYPTHAIIRPQSDRSAVPPIVAYHDLRILARAVGHGAEPTLTPSKVRRLAALSSQELRRRERHHQTLTVSDLFERPNFAQMRTINHPGNPVWEELAGRVRRRLGLGPVIPLVRPLLDGVHAPRETEVIDAFALEAHAEPFWHVDGAEIDPGEVVRAHLAWYRRHPDAVAEGLTRHAPALQILCDR